MYRYLMMGWWNDVLKILLKKCMKNSFRLFIFSLPSFYKKPVVISSLCAAFAAKYCKVYLIIYYDMKHDIHALWYLTSHYFIAFNIMLILHRGSIHYPWYLGIKSVSNLYSKQHWNWIPEPRSKYSKEVFKYGIGK